MVTTMMAMSEPGIFLFNLGISAIIRMLRMPISVLHRSMLPILRK